VKEQSIRITGRMGSKRIEGVSETPCSILWEAFPQHPQHGHPGLASPGSGLGLRPNAHFPGDDGGPQIPFREVVICRNLTMGRPMIQASGVSTEAVLNLSDPGMLGGMLDHREDPSLDAPGLPVEGGLGDRGGAQPHRLAQQGSQRLAERVDLAGLGELLGEIGDVPKQVGIAILDGARDPIVGMVAVHHEHAGKALRSEDFLGDRRRAGLPEPEHTELWGRKQPHIPILAIGTPPRLVRMFDRGVTILLDQTRRHGADEPG